MSTVSYIDIFSRIFQWKRTAAVTFYLSPSLFPFKAVVIGEMYPSVQEERGKFGPCVQESKCFTHLHREPWPFLWLSLLCPPSLPSPLKLLSMTSVTPVVKARFPYLGFGLPSGSHRRNWSFLSTTVLSVGSYRLGENSLRMTYSLWKGRSHAGANSGAWGPRVPDLLL